MSFKLAVIMSHEIRRSFSARTVRRKLGEAGLKGCKVRKKLWLSKKKQKNTSLVGSVIQTLDEKQDCANVLLVQSMDRFEIAKDQEKFILGNFVHFEVLMKTLNLRPWQAAAVATILKK